METDSLGCILHTERATKKAVTEYSLIYRLINDKCVLIEGEDEQSNKLVESFSDKAVSELVIRANCVALLLPVKRSVNIL